MVRTETDLKRLFPREAWNKLHLQIIFYGREHCTPLPFAWPRYWWVGLRVRLPEMI